MRSNRLKRIDDQLRRIISEAILTKVRDPRIGLVTVTGVEISPEFDTAKVWVSVYGDENDRDESLEGLRSAAPFLQAEISHEIRLRRIPRLRFLYDDSIERSFRIEAALRGMAEERPADDAADTPADAGEAAESPRTAPDEDVDDRPGR